ncbi:hypothetical protein A2188_01785 [Candidatus Woesebacteria bacterium RIFOXYA1_FULL_43_9]|uniref:BrnT family toxin n=1 Tax=Candidatus Woesebacteria bacterium RIFOXYA1_FULL_43_9 TaxID=1802534 RepID=A0A1F8CL00_9BACT|nr:MAG: hypothetical protein A2188_01785 [Candidatus Woesebacteria bacterium RIFOXYA1_FULL_43_9]
MKGLPVPISFEWDEGNLDKNWEKHKVFYKEAEEVFFNKPLHARKDVVHSQVEDRYIALGITNKGRKLYIVFTVRNPERIRIISARDQSKKERGLYEKEKNH